MESAFFYNTFFGVAPVAVVKTIKPLMEAIQELPADIGQVIGEFYWNKKEALAQERLVRLQKLKETLDDRSYYDWIHKWQRNPDLFRHLRLVKVCNKTIKVQKSIDNSIKLFTPENFRTLYGNKVRDLNRVIQNCAYWARPKPQFFGQEHTDLLGTHCHADWYFCNDHSYHQGDGIVIDGEDGVRRWVPIQGCVRKVLRWTVY
jgi:hypothetical protein